MTLIVSKSGWEAAKTFLANFDPKIHDTETYLEQLLGELVGADVEAESVRLN